MTDPTRGKFLSGAGPALATDAVGNVYLTGVVLGGAPAGYPAVLRLTSAGSVYPSFGSGGLFVAPVAAGGDNGIRNGGDLLIQPDGTLFFVAELKGPGPAAPESSLLWNVYEFFLTYARIDQFDPLALRVADEQRSELDRWILSRLQKLIESAHLHYSGYSIHLFMRDVVRFIDALSRWYLRRSRRRFWKSEDDGDN